MRKLNSLYFGILLIILSGWSTKMVAQTSWSNGAWTNGAPNGAPVTLLTDYNADASFECFTLTINTGVTLTIKADRYVKVNNAITQNGTGTIVVKANGSFLNYGATSNATGTQEITLTGGGITNLDRTWHLISPAIGDGSGGAVSTDLTGFDNKYTYDETGTSQAAAWVPLVGTTVTPTIGLLVHSNVGFTKSVTGTFNKGQINRTINASNQGYFLVGNPFPGTIDFNTFHGSNGFLSSTVWTWNSATMNYGTWDGTVGVNGGSRYLASGQGFFVKSGFLNQNLTLTFQNQNIYSLSPATFKSKQATNNTLRFKVDNGTFSDETLIYFGDTELKSNKFFSMNSGVPQLWTSENTEKFSIVRLINPLAVRDFNLNFQAIASGEYSLAIPQFSFDNGVEVLLEDNVTKSVTNISQENTIVKFNYTVGESSNRFTVHFNKIKTANAELKIDDLKMYSNNKTLYLNYKENSTGKVEIFNLTGGKLLQLQLQHALTTSLSTGAYMVKVTTNNNVTSQKLFFN
jgi:hypothetical protein